VNTCLCIKSVGFSGRELLMKVSQLCNDRHLVLISLTTQHIIFQPELIENMYLPNSLTLRGTLIGLHELAYGKRVHCSDCSLS